MTVPSTRTPSGDQAFQIEDGDAEEAWKAVTEWRSIEEDLDVAKAALALYDFDPDSGGDRAAAETATAELGSFAGSLSTTGGSGVSRTA